MACLAGASAIPVGVEEKQEPRQLGGWPFHSQGLLLGYHTHQHSSWGGVCFSLNLQKLHTFGSKQGSSSSEVVKEPGDQIVALALISMTYEWVVSISYAFPLV